MISEVVDKRTQARERIKAAAWGLAILLTSWILLNAVNPQLVNACNILAPTNALGTLNVPPPPKVTSILGTEQQLDAVTNVSPNDQTSLQNALDAYQQIQAECTNGPTDPIAGINGVVVSGQGLGGGCLPGQSAYRTTVNKVATYFSACTTIKTPNVGVYKACYYNKSSSTN